jgi:hypothetical protein
MLLNVTAREALEARGDAVPFSESGKAEDAAKRPGGVSHEDIDKGDEDLPALGRDEGSQLQALMMLDLLT